MDVLFVLKNFVKLHILLQAPCASMVMGIPLIIMIIHILPLKVFFFLPKKCFISGGGGFPGSILALKKYTFF